MNSESLVINNPWCPDARLPDTLALIHTVSSISVVQIQPTLLGTSK